MTPIKVHALALSPSVEQLAFIIHGQIMPWYLLTFGALLAIDINQLFLLQPSQSSLFVFAVEEILSFGKHPPILPFLLTGQTNTVR